EQLVMVLVERRTRDDHGTADVPAGEVIDVGRFGQAGFVIQPVARVHRVVAGREVTLTVETGTARLRDAADDDWTLRVFGREVRAENLDFLDHVGVGVNRRGAIAAGI